MIRSRSGSVPASQAAHATHRSSSQRSGMEAFEYLAPRSLADAYSALANGKRSAVLAGGTDIIVQLREGRRSAEQVIDVKHIPELMSLELKPDGSLAIGAAVPCAAIYDDPAIARAFPGLIDAASLIGGIQIQGRASLGGNLCNASPAADSAPALIALGATLTIGGPAGTRTLAVEDFFTGPGRSALQPGELLLQIQIPAPAPNTAVFYHRFIPRNEMDIAVASAGVSLSLDASGDRISAARLALGAVGPTPLVVDVDSALVGKAPDEAAFAAAGEAAAAVASPITDMRGSVAQRRHLSRVLTVRALEGALARIRQGRS